MTNPDQKNEIYIGMALIGTTGLLIGLVMDSPLLMVIATSVSYTHLTLPTSDLV